jgi:4-aminobutyrate aminotransferase-like enzyme
MANREIINLNRGHVFLPWAVRSKGSCFWNAEGSQYLDFLSQPMNVNPDHGNQKIVHTLQEQVSNQTKGDHYVLRLQWHNPAHRPDVR